MSGPLADVRVVEFAGQGPAPFAGGMLAEMGADVVRVDRSGSQTILSRRGNFYDRNKRSILLNLKDPSDKAAALGLVARADLIIEGFRPGVMEKLGLGPDTLLAANPAVVIGRMTGWGQTGPMAMQPGHDINYLALTGALHAIGPAEYPVPPLSIVADIGGGGLYLVVGLLSAMHLARRTGIGQVIDAAMVDGVTHMMMIIEAFHQEGRWEDRRGVNLLDGGAPYYGVYRTADGKFIAVGAIEEQFYHALVDALGFDRRALPDRHDKANWPDLKQAFADKFLTLTRAEWEARMAGRDACFSPVLSLEEAPKHPHMAARDVYLPFDGMSHPAPAPRFSKTPSCLYRPTPEPGEHTDEILRDWGVIA